jgi:hypothetical protein
MKKTLLLLFICSFSIAALGQSYLGVFGGLNNGRLQGDVPDRAQYKGKSGANVGAFIDIHLGKALYLSLQPSYSQEGTRIVYTLPEVEEPIDSIRIGLNYVSVPVLLKVTSTNERWYAIGGIETGFLMDSYIESEGVKEEIQTSVTEINIALQFGAGFKIPIKFGRFFLEVRYCQGLVNLTDEPIDESFIPRVKTAGFKFLGGYEIPLSKNKSN